MYVQKLLNEINMTLEYRRIRIIPIVGTKMKNVAEIKLIFLSKKLLLTCGSGNYHFTARSLKHDAQWRASLIKRFKIINTQGYSFKLWPTFTVKNKLRSSPRQHQLRM